jgi:glycyl-tRNA synthetase beta chain
MEQLLVEIGTEEIPAGYIEPALEALSENLLRHLQENRISHGKAEVFGTPRRLAVKVEAVAARQAPQMLEKTGPPVQAAFDASGAPTVAARKFAEKFGVSPDQLISRETGKGRYVVARKTDRGRSTLSILKDSLPSLILSVGFPKTMRWADLSIHFARPIHSLAALLGSKVVSFSLGDVRSTRYTFGHRFLHPGRIKLKSASDYPEVLESAWVIADIAERRRRMEEQMAEAVRTVGGRVLPDPELSRTVTHLVEYPATVLGAFDSRFLELPREVLITAMREHQRYFAVTDLKDCIMPYFLAVNNTPARDMDLVRQGHERVLQARLEDARFFFHADLRTSLDTMTEKLKTVLFQAELGTVHEKVRRVRESAGSLARLLELDAESRRSLERAAWLCKADLVSQMVTEFPKLQGVMGRVYAAASGEADAVCRALEEHYRPTASGAGLPESPVGAILSIADKMDTICGCFLVGLTPTGASDPYALRRQGIGVLQIVMERRFPLSIQQLVQTGRKAFPGIDAAIEQGTAAEQTIAFLTSRFAHMLESEGISKDAVQAVLAVSEGDSIPVAAVKARSLERLKTEPEFATLAVGFKRVVNIIRKADAGDMQQTEADPGLFVHEAESDLLTAFHSVSEKVRRNLREGSIEDAFAEVSSLRKSVDRFFDDVLVMTDDARLRRNRLALLNQISQLFGLLADFSRIST